MRNYFKSKESQAKEKESIRLRRKHLRRVERARIERDCRPQAEDIAAKQKIAEHLTALAEIELAKLKFKSSKAEDELDKLTTELAKKVSDSTRRV